MVAARGGYPTSMPTRSQEGLPGSPRACRASNNAVDERAAETESRRFFLSHDFGRISTASSREALQRKEMNAMCRVGKIQYATVVVLVGFIGCSQVAAETTESARTGLIVFSAVDANNRFQIFSVKPDGSDKKQLTHQGSNVTPAWTPDGKRIIFASDRSGTREIYLMNEDGSELESSVGNRGCPDRP